MDRDRPRRSGPDRPTLSDDGWIATGSTAGNVRVWSADGELVADLPIQPDDPPSVTFAPGTDTLYYEDGDGVIRRFDRRPGRDDTAGPVAAHPWVHAPTSAPGTSPTRSARARRVHRVTHSGGRPPS